jgi:uroporphyrinogen-III decarboxylase
MDPVLIRQKFPKLVLIGGMDNTDTLINGPPARVEAEAKELIALGRHGGLIIGAHSISPEVPLEHFQAYHRVCRTDGNFETDDPPPPRRGNSYFQ